MTQDERRTRPRAALDEPAFLVVTRLDALAEVARASAYCSPCFAKHEHRYPPAGGDRFFDSLSAAHVTRVWPEDRERRDGLTCIDCRAIL